jgi:outer membrane autotransporter protein
MKKIAIASIIALAATAASALEIGVVGTRDYSGVENRNGAGVTLGNTYGKVGVTAGFERATKGDNDQDRYSLVAGYDAARLGPVTVTPKVGVAYLNNQVGENGYAMTVGLGASVPVTKQVSLTADVARQYGQDRVTQFDGNRVTVGLKYRF